MQNSSYSNNTQTGKVPFKVVWGISIIFLVYAVALSYFLYSYMEKQLVQSATISYNKAINEYQKSIERISDFSFDLAAKYHDLDEVTKSRESESIARYTELQHIFKEELSVKEGELMALQQQLETDKKQYDDVLKQKEATLAQLEKKVLSIQSEKVAIEKQKKNLSTKSSAPIAMGSNKETLSLKGDIGQEVEALKLLKAKVDELDKSCSTSKNPDDANCLELARNKAELNKAEKKLAFMQAKMKYLVN